MFTMMSYQDYFSHILVHCQEGYFKNDEAKWCFQVHADVGAGAVTHVRAGQLSPHFSQEMLPVTGNTKVDTETTEG